VENLCVLNSKDIAHAVRSDGEKFLIEGPTEYMPAVGESIVFVVRGASAAKPLRPWSYYDRLGSANEQSLNSKIFSLPNNCSPILTHEADENETADSSQHSRDATWKTTRSQTPSETASVGGLWGYFGSLFDTRSMFSADINNEDDGAKEGSDVDVHPTAPTREQTSPSVPPRVSPGSLASTAISTARASKNGPRPAVPWSYYSSMAQNNYDADQ